MMRSHTVVFPLAVPPATPMIKGSARRDTRLRERWGWGKPEPGDSSSVAEVGLMH